MLSLWAFHWKYGKAISTIMIPSRKTGVSGLNHWSREIDNVRTKARKLFVPAERHETIRQEIIESIRGQTLSTKDISVRVRIEEKEVFEHLEHIRMSMGRGEHELVVTPARCSKCGFVFRKRERLSKPGKCPICRTETIEEPLFSIT